MSAIPAKIVLKSTTKMSLNDRFTNIQKMAPAVQNVRAQMAATNQASAKNRRLAQQMANRPAVQAALKIKQRSMQQRLGTQQRLGARPTTPGNSGISVKQRLNLSARGRGRGTFRQSPGGATQIQQRLGSPVGRGGRPGRGRGVAGGGRGMVAGGRGTTRGGRGAVRGALRGGRTARGRTNVRGYNNTRGRHPVGGATIDNRRGRGDATRQQRGGGGRNS